jgi:hypothetical protein
MLKSTEEYKPWCPILARYSFHTRTMTTGSSAFRVQSAPVPDVAAGASRPRNQARTEETDLRTRKRQ